MFFSNKILSKPSGGGNEKSENCTSRMAPSSTDREGEICKIHIRNTHTLTIEDRVDHSSDAQHRALH